MWYHLKTKCLEGGTLREADPEGREQPRWVAVPGGEATRRVPRVHARTDEGEPSRVRPRGSRTSRCSDAGPERDGEGLSGPAALDGNRLSTREIRVRNADDVGGALRYPLEVFWVEEDEAWFAISPVFGPGVSAFGETPAAAVSALADVLEAVEESYRERGIPLPTEYSGRLNLRLPKSLHAQLARQAEVEGVSLNTLMVVYLSEKAGRSAG